MNTCQQTTLWLGILLFAALVLAPACGGDDEDLPEIDCATVDVPTFAEVALFPQCTICHSTQLDGAARNGAPADVNYDDYNSAVASATEGVEQVYAGKMPPVGNPTQTDKDDFYAWAMCGTPQ